MGRLAALLGRPDEAVARLRRAVAENERAGAGARAAGALFRLGEALTAAGDPDAASDVMALAFARAVWSYARADDALADAVRDLVEACRLDWPEVTREVISLRGSGAQAFSDAFRLRRRDG